MRPGGRPLGKGLWTFQWQEDRCAGSAGRPVRAGASEQACLLHRHRQASCLRPSGPLPALRVSHSGGWIQSQPGGSEAVSLAPCLPMSQSVLQGAPSTSTGSLEALNCVLDLGSDTRVLYQDSACDCVSTATWTLTLVLQSGGS